MAAHVANRDTAVAAWLRRGPQICAAVLVAAFAAACTPAAPPDSPATLRAEEADAEGDEGTADPAQPAAKSPGPLVWLSSEQEASTRSHAERRPMLVHFATEWCADCKRMAKETFGDPRVKTRAGRFVAVQFDATNEDDPQVTAALSKYAVINVPTLILLDSSGREQRRFTGIVLPEELLGEIDKVR